MPSFPCPADLCVLVVDDHPFMLDIIATILHRLGLTDIETASDGEAALQRIEARRIDLVICDLNMPGMDGIRLLSRIAVLPSPPAIILLSGEDPRILEASQRFAEAKALTIVGALRKPIEVGVLADLLRNYRPGAQREVAKAPHHALDGGGIRRGLAEQAVAMAYQPKVDLCDGSVVGLEALLRWRDPSFGVLPSLDVVRAAEESDTIDDLTIAVLARVAEDRAELVRNGFDLNVAVNVSMHNLRNLMVVDRIADIVSQADDAPDHYTLEVTETRLLDDVALVLEALIRLRLLGFRIAIDDYGTGAATMQFLMQLPSNELKIDRSFVAAAPRNEQGRVLLQSAVELGLELGQLVIAEGIETENEASLARQMGCHGGQGFLFGRPMMMDALLPWMRENRVHPHHGQGAIHER